jgi:hypothetical protein
MSECLATVSARSTRRGELYRGFRVDPCRSQGGVSHRLAYVGESPSLDSVSQTLVTAGANLGRTAGRPDQRRVRGVQRRRSGQLVKHWRTTLPPGGCSIGVLCDSAVLALTEHVPRSPRPGQPCHTPVTALPGCPIHESPTSRPVHGSRSRCSDCRLQYSGHSSPPGHVHQVLGHCCPSGNVVQRRTVR